MDQLNHYRTLVRSCLLEWHAYMTRSPLSGVDTECIFDDDRGHYLIANSGWHAGERVREAFIHIRIRDGKIWIEEDGTEDGIATELIRAGIPRDDIVLAFHPPQLRHLTEFASA